MTWLLTACSGDPTPTSAPTGQQSAESPLQLTGITRADMGEAEPGNIKVWLFSDATLTEGLFQHTGESAWSTLFNVKSGSRTYALYGCMPCDETKAYSLSSASDDGAVLTLDGLDAMSADDICIVTGVSRATAKPVPAPVRGLFHFDYVSNQNNYLQLLFEHLYGRLAFKIKIGSDYHQLRDITLKSLRVEATGISTLRTAITLRRNIGIREVSYTPTATANSTHEVWSGSHRLTESGSDLLGGVNILPDAAVTGQLRLVATYDVFDKQGHLVRRDCTTTNQLNTVAASLLRGEQKNVTLSVEPSYLYTLSDWDTPTFHIIEGE